MTIVILLCIAWYGTQALSCHLQKKLNIVEVLATSYKSGAPCEDQTHYFVVIL